MFTSEETSKKATDAAPGQAQATTAAPVSPAVIEHEDRRRQAPTSLIDPVYVARSVWQSKTLIIATTIAGIAIAVLVASNTPKRFVATTQILMDPRDLKVVANEITPNGLPSEATLALVESQTAVIMSSNVLSRVISEARLEDDPEFNGRARTGVGALVAASLQSVLPLAAPTPEDIGYETLARLRHALTVGRETKSFVINLSVDSQDPDKAARIANLTAGVFIDEQGRVQSETARRATSAITGRLSELRKSVVNAEQAVEDYKSQNALIGVGGRLVDDDYITRINDQLAKARGDITALRVKADSMRTASVEDVVRGTLPEELSSEALVRLRQTYSELAQQAAVLATKLGTRHPQRIASEGALSASRQAIASELSRIVAAAQTELARAETTERGLTAQIGELKDKQVTTSGSFVKLRELEREVDASRAVYEAFLLRARETGEQESLNTANVRVISEATPPLQAAGMSRKTMVAAGGIMGLMAGIAFAALIAMGRLLRAVFADRRRNRRPRWTEEQRVAAAAAAPTTMPSATTAAAAPARSTLPTPADPFATASAPVASPPAPEPAPLPVATDPAEEDAIAQRERDLARRSAEDAAWRERELAAARRAMDAAIAEDERQARANRLAEAEAAENDRLSDAARRARSARPNAAQDLAARDRLLDLGAASAPRPTREEALLQARLAQIQAATPPRSALPATDLPLSSAGDRAARPASPERLSLRERVKALSDARDRETEAERRRDAALAPEVASLHEEIRTVKQAIADIRRRRETSAERN